MLLIKKKDIQIYSDGSIIFSYLFREKSLKILVEWINFSNNKVQTKISLVGSNFVGILMKYAI